MLLLSDISMVADAKEEGMIDSRNIVAAHEIYNLAAMETMNVGANNIIAITVTILQNNFTLLIELSIRKNIQYLRMDINDPSKDAVSGIIAETSGSNLEFLYQPPFMSSRVFVPSMLDSLLFQVSEGRLCLILLRLTG